MRSKSCLSLKLKINECFNITYKVQNLTRNTGGRKPTKYKRAKCFFNNLISLRQVNSI